jgi:hypothetical protein
LPGPYALPASLSVVDWLRFLAEWGLLVPAARYLPVQLALTIADAISTVAWMVPSRARQERARELSALGIEESDLKQVMRERLILKRRDLVWLERMGRGREHLDAWTVTETNGGPVRELINAGRSFIVAGGHFTKAATKLRFKVIPPAGASVTAALPPWRFSPGPLRERLHSQVEVRARAGLLGEHATTTVEVERTPGGSARTARDQVMTALEVPGTVTQILVDAYWDRPNSYRRPFGGQTDRGFALGAARISRLAQCPIVPFVAVFGSAQRTVHIDWGDLIEPNPVDDAASDQAVIDGVLAFLEAGIRRYPTQYVD